MSDLIFARAGDTAHLTLNRPRRLNAISAAMLDGLAAALDDLAKAPPDVLILDGAGGRAFSAGADLHEVAALDGAACSARNDHARALFDRLARLPTLSLAVIEGIAFGGGLELALACRFRLARADARLALPEVKLGVMPTYGGTRRLPALIGASAALRLMLGGEPVDGGEALRLGLVDGLFESAGTAAAEAFLAPFRARPPRGRRAILEATAPPPDLGLEHEGAVARALFAEAGALDGIRRFP